MNSVLKMALNGLSAPVLLLTTMPEAENEATAPLCVLIKLRGDPEGVHVCPGAAGAAEQGELEKMPGLIAVNVNWAWAARG